MRRNTRPDDIVNLPDFPSWYSEANRRTLVIAASVLILVIGVSDWLVETNVGFGFLYLLPILLVAGQLKRFENIVLALLCAGLREWLSPFEKGLQSLPRTANVFLGFSAVGLFIGEMAKNRRQAEQHLREMEAETAERRAIEQQLQVLIESTPAAILTVNSDGRILLANEAAHQMLAFEGKPLAGESIAEYLPILGFTVGHGRERMLRTAIECRGKRRNGEVFPAHVWASTYETNAGLRLAAIVLDASDDLRDRQQSGLDRLLSSSRILVAAVSHEIRNLCGAVAVAHANMARLPALADNADFQALGSLVVGLRKLASAELRGGSQTPVPPVPLHSILDEIRIVVQPGCEDADVDMVWEIPGEDPNVHCDPQTAVQVALNMAHNSIRAMQNRELRRLTIAVSVEPEKVILRFMDSGPGITRPEALFQPFHRGAEATGIGLYVSRALLRATGGDLRYENISEGACFAIEFPRSAQAMNP